MSNTVQGIPSGDNPAVQIPLDSCPQTFVFVDSFISTITVVYAGKTYVQTFTNNGTNITAISGWVQQ